MAVSDKKAFVAGIEKQHGQRLRKFLASRLRHSNADVQDVAQEVFLRLLRLERHETIRSTEAYLFTIAFHVLHQYAMRRSAAPQAVDITTVLDGMESGDVDLDVQAETHQRMQDLERALKQLPPKAQAVLLLHRRDGYSLEEIADQLGFSRANAAKYLAKALVHCREQLENNQGRTP